MNTILTRSKARLAAGLGLAGALALGGGMLAQSPASAAGCGTNCLSGSYSTSQNFTFSETKTTLAPFAAQAGKPDSTSDTSAYSVLTNDPAGYTVTVQATTPNFMSGSTAGVPVSDLNVWSPYEEATAHCGGGPACSVPVSASTPIIVDQSSGPSAQGGDSAADGYGFVGSAQGGTDFSATQTSAPGTYVIGLQYAAVAR